jgi:diguanylate cyclase (GGDEF)-like protein
MKRRHDPNLRRSAVRGVTLAAAVVTTALYLVLPGVGLARASLFISVWLWALLAIRYATPQEGFYDPLTKMASRALFSDRLGHALRAAGRRGSPVAVLVMDLDGFKAINNTLGPRAGDHLLMGFADRIRSCVRPTDTVARLGGDEFAVLIPEGTVEDGEGIAHRILDEAKQPFLLDGREVFIAVSAGVTEAGPEGGVDEVMRNADAAMYAAKREGKGSVEVYRQHLHAPLLQRLEMGTELRHAVERGMFILHYQPVVALPGGEIFGVEALVRWNHPQRGLIPPLEFIPIAEETGLIGSIDRWVMEEACRQAKRWNENVERPPLMMHVNVSARELHDEDLTAHVKEALDSAGLEPERLTIEITESVLMEDAEATVRALQSLRDLGVSVAIDDFGIGFSSLSYLRRLPVDVVKIDRSFVEGVATRAEEWSLARGIIRLLHSLGLETVAEGIEQADQVAHLRALGCHLGQGYYFARPASAGAISPVLDKGRLGSGVRTA